MIREAVKAIARQVPAIDALVKQRNDLLLEVAGLRAQIHGGFPAEIPWPKPQPSDCIFYHSLDLPNGETIDGAWDIRGNFESYIGSYPIAGKTVLDVGTASGFLAFAAEQAGALKVTAIDARAATEIRHLQFHDSAFHHGRAEWLVGYNDGLLKRLKRGFWYAHRSLNSAVEVVYAPLEALPFWERRFDVVIAGAIFEHLSDPVTIIGNIARLANEAVIIAFTPVEDSNDLTMRTANDWTSRQHCYTWWTLSRGIYQRLFDNLGFDIEIVTARAKTKSPDGQWFEVERPTIIARRR
jgi:2-polyprenyl-3-methyl-5-hydroxy-6-metoxy-1,4-benzoquinol methylase